MHQVGAYIIFYGHEDKANNDMRLQICTTLFKKVCTGLVSSTMVFNVANVAYSEIVE